MVSLRKILALVLAALWLPAVQHCMLEAAELVEGHDDSAAHATCCATENGVCDADACSVVESGNYKPATETLAAPAPLLAVLADLTREMTVIGRELVDHAEKPRASFDRPPEFSPVWQFVQRAAQPPRAPSLIAA